MIATLKIDFYFERYLKNKFGQGFTILAKLDTQGKTAVESADIMDSFKKHIMTKFSGCVVKDEHKDYVHFHVTNLGTTWAYLFSSIEWVSSSDSDSVSKTTLEQVFLLFAKENWPMT